MRRPHYIKHNRGSGTPQHCIFFDTETQGEVIDPQTIEARLSFGWACYVRRIKGGKWSTPKWKRFEDVDSFWGFVSEWIKPKRRLYIFAHNLGFDLTQVKGFSALLTDGWECTSRIIAPKILNLTYRKDNASIRLVDTYNYYPMSLKALGNMVGLEKYDFPDEADQPELWDNYCKRDVEIMVAAMQLWWERVVDWGLGNFAVTLASQCFNAYRHRFMPRPIFIDSNERATDVGRRSYLGGRTEAFHIGVVPEKVYCLDINSMYPYIMKNKAVPYRLATTRTKLELHQLSQLLEQYAVVADVQLEVNEPCIPIKHDNRTTWPIGTFQAALTTPELIYALERGMITKVDYAAVYHQDVIFSDYVDFFYGQRLEARKRKDKATEGITKLFLNSLYGKFGQTGQRWNMVGPAEDMSVAHFQVYDADSQVLTKYRQFSGVVEEFEKLPESSESFPAIASHITAYARMYLYYLMRIAGLENIYYLDTDSLMVNEEGLENLRPHMDDSELGMLKVEWESESMIINGLKDYVVDGTAKIKGIRKDAEEVSPGIFTQEQFRGIEGMIRDGDMDRILIRTVTKKLMRQYLKGQVAETGRVFPLQLLQK
jgi:hypothetical protein